VEDLARSFAQEIAASADPQRGLNNLVRFVEGVGERTFYYELLLDRPELVPRLATLFGASNYLSAFFATHPDLIVSVFRDPDVLLLPRADLVRDLQEIRESLERDPARDPAETGPAALRLFHHRQFVNVGLLDLVGKVSIAEAQAALTLIAEVCLEEALAQARAQLEARAPAPADARAAEFLVVGMGKLASRELSYGSDLDVIFLYGAEGAGEGALLEAQDWFVRLAQKLVALLQTRTSEGVCFEVDARLRPSGSQGMLVTSLASFESYHARSAQAWERQALLRARPVAGSRSLGERFIALRRQILDAPPPPDLAAEIHRIRLRVERELAREGEGRHDFKSGRGGMVDVENVVAFLQLRHGRAFPQLFDPEPIAVQLERLASLEMLSRERARVLREAWDFLQRLSSRLRIVENRSISDLDEERTDLEAVARALGHAPSQRTGSARQGLLRDYRRHTEAVRRVYEEILGVA
jgi:glutamate-ammonia-ligase adenylyltransferase